MERKIIKQVRFVNSRKFGENIAWGVPIVIKSKEELAQAFDELETGTFFKKGISY